MLALRKAMAQLGTNTLPVKMSSLETIAGREVGVIRVSFGLASNFEDAWRLAQWADAIVDPKSRERAWQAWITDSSTRTVSTPAP
jgi:molybdenum cofactor sulfurtransferase